MSIGKGLRPRPAENFADACRRFATLAARDGPEISAAGRSQLYAHGHRTSRAVVLLHGLTSAPEQWRRFADELHVRGDSVVVPRFPGHGYVDRATHAMARVGSDDFLSVASEAVDIARGLGDRVTLAGLSVGGAMAAWLGLARDDIAQSLAIVPFIGIAKMNEPANRIVTAVLGVVPNAFVPWDPGGDNAQIPPYGYAKFPTRGLAACLAIGLDGLSRSSKAPRGRVDFALNAREPACNNALSETMSTRLAARAPGRVRTVVWNDLPAIHDIIDPTNPHARTDLVYPRLLDLISS